MHTAIRNSTLIYINITQDMKRSICQMDTSIPTLPCVVPSGFYPRMRPFLHPTVMAVYPAAVPHSPWSCFHSQDRLAVWGCSAFSAPGVKIGGNSSQKCLPTGWFSCALLLCLEDTGSAQAEGTGKPRGILTKLCLQQGVWIVGYLEWILGKISFLKEWSDIGTGCPGKWWSPHPWRCSKEV